MKLFWNFKNKLLSGRRSHQFEFSGQVNSIFANSEKKKSRLPIVLFFKINFLVLEALWIAPNLALKSNDVFLDIFITSQGSFGSNYCYIHFDVSQCILNGLSYYTLLPIQEKRYSDCKLPSIEAQIGLSSTFVYDQKMSTSGSSARNSHLSQGGRMAMMPMSANWSV